MPPLAFSTAQPDLTAGLALRPPLTPRWAFEPWVWEDEENSARATLQLVDDYRSQGLPVGVVIVDSPWQTNYNTFEFGPNYPDPDQLVRELHRRNVKVLLWATGFMNLESIDGFERGKAAVYDEAYAAGFFVNSGQDYKWDKGRGSAIDFFNPQAVAWLYARMDRAFSLGFDGWKVDSPEGNLPQEVQTAAGRKTEREYGTAYYRAFYEYVTARRRDGIITARPFDDGTTYAPVDANPAGWVGDQIPDWGRKGIEEALDNMLASAELGYAVVGSDIGGYRPGNRSEKLFARWTELGALSPLMENGGRGEHRPWKQGPNVLRIYRYYSRLHHQLVPYLFSAGVEAHQTGRPIIRDVDRVGSQYSLGPDLLVAPVVTREDERDIRLLAGSRWYDYWNDELVLDGGTTLRRDVPTRQIPLFIRAGAIIPMQVSDAETGHGDGASAGHLTLLLYPDGESTRTYYPAADRPVVFQSRRESGRVSVEIGPSTERYLLRIKESGAPGQVTLQRGASSVQMGQLDSREAFNRAAEGWHYDPIGHYLWVRFATRDGGAVLSYTAAP